MSDFASVLHTQFNRSVANEDFNLLNGLKALYPNAQHVALEECNFPLSGFLLAKSIKSTILEGQSNGTHQLFSWDKSSHHLYLKLLSGTLQFTYKDTQFIVYKASWTRDHVLHNFYDFVYGSKDGTDALGQELVSEVYEWSHALKDEMWVFEQGGWKKDKALWAAIQSASWDEIVLETAFLEGLRRDTETFFSSHEIYRSLGITWKRGLLLLGPPGNGKTESIKALLKESGQAALYVKSFTTPYGPEAGVKSIFEHARNSAPCILVIEDLDSLVSPDVRSFFLNELDGLAQNEGILTIATTNHPERIDDAILNRPSRFDVKYNFALPTSELRVEYILKWIRKTQRIGKNAELSIVFEEDVDTLAKDLAEKTDGWSFAFLKELFVSFLLRIAHDKSRSQHEKPALTSASRTINANHILLQQINQLSSQIIKVKEDLSNQEEGAKTSRQTVNTRAQWIRAQAQDTLPLNPGSNF